MFYFNVKLFIVCKCGNKKKDTIGSILLQKVIRFLLTVPTLVMFYVLEM